MMTVLLKPWKTIDEQLEILQSLTDLGLIEDWKSWELWV